MVQRTGSQGQGNVLFVQNNFYYDAFFLKAIGMLLTSFTVDVLMPGTQSSTERAAAGHVQRQMVLTSIM